MDRSKKLNNLEKLALSLGWKKWQDEFGDGWIWTPPGHHDMNHARGMPTREELVEQEVTKLVNKVKNEHNK